jgi:hypothetical protein
VEKMGKIHSKRVEKMLKIHSKRVEKITHYFIVPPPGFGIDGLPH